jgi:hypothetical protein
MFARPWVEEYETRQRKLLEKEVRRLTPSRTTPPPGLCAHISLTHLSLTHLSRTSHAPLTHLSLTTSRILTHHFATPPPKHVDKPN